MAGHAVITEDALERIRQRIGVPVPRPHPYISLASQDAIRHFAHGMGDDNPLWTDPAYAATTRYGCIIAPPLYSLCHGRYLQWPIRRFTRYSQHVCRHAL